MVLVYLCIVPLQSAVTLQGLSRLAMSSKYASPPTHILPSCVSMLLQSWRDPVTLTSLEMNLHLHVSLAYTSKGRTPIQVFPVHNAYTRIPLCFLMNVCISVISGVHNASVGLMQPDSILLCSVLVYSMKITFPGSIYENSSKNLDLSTITSQVAICSHQPSSDMHAYTNIVATHPIADF